MKKIYQLMYFENKNLDILQEINKINYRIEESKKFYKDGKEEIKNLLDKIKSEEDKRNRICKYHLSFWNRLFSAQVTIDEHKTACSIFSCEIHIIKLLKIELDYYYNQNMTLLTEVNKHVLNEL